ncbi:MAG: ATP-dependent helicase UvrD/PcrA, partial [Actinomycetota bacterium]|nr:ATP-dependent helicase UvrD/PcrA [Actinomycetota bacterium]
VLPGPLRGDADDQPDLAELSKGGVTAYDDDCRSHLEREERRLGYVAFTRARRLLIGSGHWWGPTQKKKRGPSPFLGELRAHADEGHGAVDVWTEEPTEDLNPALEVPAVYVWPTPYDEAPYLRRRTAADQVLADLAVLEAGAGLPPLGDLNDGERKQIERLDREAALLLEEARAARRPIRDVLLPSTLSASSVLRLQADPDGFARDLARPMPRRPVAAARRGTRFHAWVETLFVQRPLLDPDELPGAEDDAIADDTDLAVLQDAFLATPYAIRKPHVVEAPFALSLGGRVVRGRIDAVYDLGDGRWEVVDWKTGNEAADPLQLAIYRLAWAKLVDVAVQQVDAAFLYVRTGEVVRHDGLPGEAELTALLQGPGLVEAEPLTLL